MPQFAQVCACPPPLIRILSVLSSEKIRSGPPPLHACELTLWVSGPSGEMVMRKVTSSHHLNLAGSDEILRAQVPQHARLRMERCLARSALIHLIGPPTDDPVLLIVPCDIIASLIQTCKRARDLLDHDEVGSLCACVRALVCAWVSACARMGRCSRVCMRVSVRDCPHACVWGVRAITWVFHARAYVRVRDSRPAFCDAHLAHTPPHHIPYTATVQHTWWALAMRLRIGHALPLCTTTI